MTEGLNCMSETVKQLLFDGAECRPMEAADMCAISFNDKNHFSYCVAHLSVNFKSTQDLLKHLMQEEDVITSLRFY